MSHSSERTLPTVSRPGTATLVAAAFCLGALVTHAPSILSSIAAAVVRPGVGMVLAAFASGLVIGVVGLIAVVFLAIFRIRRIYIDGPDGSKAAQYRRARWLRMERMAQPHYRQSVAHAGENIGS